MPIMISGEIGVVGRPDPGPEPDGGIFLARRGEYLFATPSWANPIPLGKVGFGAR